MDLHCPSCGLSQPTSHTFCLRCGLRLPRHLLEPRQTKQVRMFPGIKVSDGDLDPGFLRVSCYLKKQHFETAEGSVMIPGHHVRFSIWDSDQARCVLSIPESEARELASFVLDELDRMNGATPEPV
jgi:hypothetical protein